MTQKKLKITVSGKVYDVMVEVLDEGSPVAAAPRPRPVAPTPASTPAPTPAAAPRPAVSGPGLIPAPLAGIVVSVEVNVGDTVKADQTVVMLEAMKMQTAISAPSAGTVQEILVKRGDTVPEGTPLIRIG